MVITRVESEECSILRANPSSSSRFQGTKLFPNRSGRVANSFDCARQLILGHTKVPRPIFNMVLTLDNDFAAVRTDFIDHFIPSPWANREGNGVTPVSFRLTGW
jgi:hypothetical protein